MTMPFPWAIELPPPVRELEGAERPVLRFPRTEYIKLVSRQAERMTVDQAVKVRYRFTGGKVYAFNMSGGADTPGKVTVCLRRVTLEGATNFYAMPTQLLQVGEFDMAVPLRPDNWVNDAMMIDPNGFALVISDPTTIGLAFGDDATGSMANGVKADTLAQITLLSAEVTEPPT